MPSITTAYSPLLSGIPSFSKSMRLNLGLGAGPERKFFGKVNVGVAMVAIMFYLKFSERWKILCVGSLVCGRERF